MPDQPDDFTPAEYRRSELHVRAAATEHVAAYLDWLEGQEHVLDDELVELLVDISAALLSVGLPIRSSNSPADTTGAHISDLFPAPDGRPQVYVSWSARDLAVRDHTVWRQGLDIMTRALVELLRLHGFEVTPQERELTVRRPPASSPAPG